MPKTCKKCKQVIGGTPEDFGCTCEKWSFRWILWVILVLVGIGLITMPHRDKSLIEPAGAQTSSNIEDFDFLGESVYTPEFRSRMTYRSTLTANSPIPEPYLPELIANKAKSEHLSPKIMLSLAKCESGTRHAINGKIIRGRLTPHDVGIFQISEIYWRDKAKELGFNIYEPEGNINMAMWIADKYGYEKWVCYKLL